ncbi:MAG TPA: septum formation initiator family protein [Devosia sp.]|jgi:cell division protein FtsB|uniref:FtsB family cell division protein n=1 Tax=Devosia sp. TaxID=1871048 RepID=UPI002DDD7EF7|nr:septum formation initiator family protein [Devosia sp.]HEV2515481.1 septum formation initiator family protein [Devosia sp.]
MPTRLKRPAFWRHVALALGLIAFQGYLGYSVVTGQFGIESQDVLEAEIDELNAKSGALQAEIDSFRHRIDLFQTTRMDPDLVSERARALLSMAQPDDIVVMVNPANGKPLSSSSAASTTDQLSGIIEDGID